MRTRQDAAPAGADTLALGDIVSFRGGRWLVTAYQGAQVFLTAEPDTTIEPLIILQTVLTSAQDFAVLNRAAARTRITRRAHELQTVPTALRREVERWENIVKEVLHQQAPNVPATTPPKPDFDPKRHTLKDRYRTKAAQMTAAGWVTSAATVERKCRAWRKDGLLGLVDRRSQRPASAHGHVDARVIEVVWELLDSERREGVSPGTMSRLIGRVQRTIRTRYAAELAAADETKRAALLPSQATFYRLLGRLGISADSAHAVAAHRAAGPPRTAGRPDMRPATMARWPGELVQIDTTGLDVLVLSDDGKIISVELTVAVDVATRSIVGSLIVPKRFRREAGAGRWLGGRATRSFDTLQVLAQATAPLPVRPGWAPQTFMEGSDLPYEQLLAVDERFAGAAARPVIRPETLVVDHGSPFVSADFTRSCNAAGIEVREARLRTAVDKAIVERAMLAIKTGFSQHLAVYTHHRLALRGRRVRQQPLFTIAHLQDLFEQWVALHWQQTPHGGLRSPFTPGLKLTPNKMYAALIFLRGYRSTALTEGENRNLLPTVWARVNRKGFQINNPHLQPRSRAAGSFRRLLGARGGPGALGGALLPQRSRGGLAVQPPRRHTGAGVGGGAVHSPASADRSVDRRGVGTRHAGTSVRRRPPRRSARHRPGDTASAGRARCRSVQRPAPARDAPPPAGTAPTGGGPGTIRRRGGAAGPSVGAALPSACQPAGSHPHQRPGHHRQRAGRQGRELLGAPS
ncbi:hypothetical protein [Streptomyces cyaneofuscatus]|uniref:hypothetical protein n=1 Tax=Streptomyces cyaneofuscatus TaxID=66883 RepID=UPI0033A43BCE